MLKCPACNGTLREKNVPGMTVDICHGGCGGVWFDANELQRIDGRSAATLHSVWQHEPWKRPEKKTRLCPRCPDQVLGKRWFSEAKAAEIDQCPKCDGIWLDDGEFTRLAREMKKHQIAPPGWAKAMADAVAAVEKEELL